MSWPLKLNSTSKNTDASIRSFRSQLRARRPYSLPIEEVTASARKGLKKSYRWKGRLSNLEVCLLLSRFKRKFKILNFQPATLAKWVDYETAPSKHYIVRTGTHFVHVHDGKVSDQHESFAPIATAKAGRLRVKYVWEIKNPAA